MKKKLLSILLVLSLMLALVPAAFAADIVDSGTCGAEGSDVRWTLDSNGVLVISGTGEISGGSSGGCMWADKGVTVVEIRSGVTGIRSGAFSGCDDLSVITLPDTVTTMDSDALNNCSGLSTILVDAANPAYKSVDGALYSKDGTVLVKAPMTDTVFVVPDGVTKIGPSAFFADNSLETVCFPASGLTEIGEMAFYGCRNLQEVSLPEGVTRICGYAFAHCERLQTVSLPVSLQLVGEMAFLSAGPLDTGISAVNYAGTQQQWSEIQFSLGAVIHLDEVHKNYNTELHAFGAWTATGTRSCTQVVTMQRTCTNAGCGLVERVVLPALGHVCDDYTVVREPSGLLAGVIEITCLRCGRDCIVYTVPEISAEEQFADISTDDWFYGGVSFCAMTGLMGGMDKTTFSPNTAATRAQFVQILYAFSGKQPVSGTTKFTDLTDSWYQDAVLWAYQNQIIGGVTETEFAPSAPITRAQIVQILIKYLHNVLKKPAAEPADLSIFADSDSVPGWGREAMAEAVARGMIGGFTESGAVYLKPAGSATRAQVATILKGFCESIA